MEWSILFLGSVGSGKTQAIRTMSDIETVSTEAVATDATALLKRETTVAMDVGVMHLGEGDKVVLYGAPGQDRFDFMWEILLPQVRGVVVLVDRSTADPIADLHHYLDRLRELDDGQHRPLIVGVTHSDVRATPPLQAIRDSLAQKAANFGGALIPVFRVDARERSTVNKLLLGLTAMMEFGDRYPRRMAA